MKKTIALILLVLAGCSNLGRETAITSLSDGVKANDAQVSNLADIAHALNVANAQNRLRAGDNASSVMRDFDAVNRDIEQQRVNHADANRVFDYADIWMQSQRWGPAVLYRLGQQAATTQPSQ